MLALPLKISIQGTVFIPPQSDSPKMAAPAKDRISCHVLDTTSGRPAPALRVQLSPAGPSAFSSSPSSSSSSSADPSKVLEALTDDDGRIKFWKPKSGSDASFSLHDLLAGVKGTSRWTLRFDVEGYWSAQGKDAFFPEVVVVFDVQEGQGYHVPLLLGPYNYTTYRGS